MEPAYPSGFSRYWTHYNFMHSWIQKHHQVLADSSAGERSYRQLTPDPNSQEPVFKVPLVSNLAHKEPHHSAIGEGSRTPTRPRALPSQAKPKKRKAKRRNESFSSTGSQPSSAKNAYIEAELNDDFLEFMQQSALHRKEREAAKLKDSEERMEVDANGLLLSEKARMAAPTEQPGMRRTHEIRLLYGDQSNKIHGLETAQQLCFQQACDKKKPLHWPNIPLRLEFT